MAKRIIELTNTNSPKSTMFMAVDQQESGGAGTYRSAIHTIVGSVIGKDAAASSGGKSLKMVKTGSTYDICLQHTLHVPAANSTEGGQVKMFYTDGRSASVDAFVDTGGAYKSLAGGKIGANRKWFRVLIPNASGNEYAALLIDGASGEIYKPVSTTNTNTLIPVGGTDSSVSNKLDEIEQRLAALGSPSVTGAAHESATPPAKFTSGSLWFDTDTAKMYVYDGLTWVVVTPR